MPRGMTDGMKKYTANLWQQQQQDNVGKLCQQHTVQPLIPCAIGRGLDGDNAQLL